MICKICGSDKNDLIFKGLGDLEYGLDGKFDFNHCLKCRVIFLQPTPSNADLLNFYPNDYHGYNSPRSALTSLLIRLNLKNRASFYKKLIGEHGDILDIGSADGAHFEILKEFGKWNFAGIEFNDKVAQVGRNRGHEIYTETIETCNFGERKFDLIIMNHLIEHVGDPALTVSKAADLLKEGGYLIGETPNNRSFDFLIFKKYWGGLHVPRHTFIFNSTSLRQLLLKSGFLPGKFNYSMDTSHWALSVQNYFQSQARTKSKLVQGRAFYFPFFLILFVPINFIQKIFGWTGIVRFTAKKA
jgi:SAM-dependent methyltransferase